MTTVLPMYRYSTQHNHRHILTKHLVPHFGSHELCDLSRADVQAYVAELTHAGYAPKTIDHIHDVLSAVLRTAVTWGHLRDSPAHGVKLPELRTVRPKPVLTIEQAQRLLAMLDMQSRTMVGLALLTGIRRGELFGLRWRDVDLLERVITVEQAVYEGHFGPPKTRAGERCLPLSDAAHALLAAWRQEARSMRPDDLVFATRTGKPISPNNVLRRSVFPVGAALGLPHSTWLTFRRTYASWSHDLGVPTKVTAELMGHAKVDVTLSAYTQTLATAHAAAAARIGDQLFTHCSQSGGREDDRRGLTH
jgi:integrase